MENTQFDYDQVKEQIQKLLKTLEEIFSENTNETKQKIDTYVKENPWHAVGIVMLIGVIIGLFLGHSKNGKK